MKPPVLITPPLLATCLLPLTTAYLHVPILKNHTVASQQLARRQSDKTVTEPLTQGPERNLYFAEVAIGTPPQTVQLQIDTGSSDLWVPDAESRYCRTRGCEGDDFNSSQSSTFEVVGADDFTIYYLDETYARGDYFTDTLRLSSATLPLQMGLGTNTTIGLGIMGIAFANSEANVVRGNGTEYPNLPLALVNAGLITTPAYSLFLSSLDSSHGSILFGGIDTSKFEPGALKAIPLYPNARRGEVTSFVVALTSLSATSSSGSDILTPPDFAIPVILDSGTTLTYLPDSLAFQIFTEVDAVQSPLNTGTDSDNAIPLVPCALANNTGTLDFAFAGPGGPVVKVPMSELVFPLQSGGRESFFSDGTEACQFGILPAGEKPYLLGDTFLRSAYVVFDLENEEVGIAQRRGGVAGVREGDVVEFESRGAAIPRAERVSAMVTVSETGEPGTRGSGQADGSGGGGVGPQGSATHTAGLSAASGFEENACGRVRVFSADVAVLVVCWMVFCALGGGVFVWA